jgi:undecaprenyl-diphosphatase
MLSPTARRRLGDADVAWSDALRAAVNEDGIVRRGTILAARSADGWLVLPIVLGCWAYGAASALPLAVCVVVTGVLVFALKFSIRRSRPEGEWGGGYRRFDPHSFPSGHAARVGAMATFVALVGPWPLTLAVLAWALAVAFARVALGVHYLSDVVAGVALGVATGVGAALFR